MASPDGTVTKLLRRQFLRLAAGAAALPMARGIAKAEAYPRRTVRVIVSSAAGGTPEEFLLIPGVGSRMFHWPDESGAPKCQARMISGLPRPAQAPS